MKALGWYISVHKEIKQIKIANRMHTDPASISRYVISPKDAQCINEQNYEQSGKRLIDIEKAVEICGHMGTTLENILYYYQFKNTLDKLPNFDSLEKLTNQLMCVENEKENTTQDFQNVIDHLWQECWGSICIPPYTTNLIMEADHPGFLPWIGRYYCYFSSTSSDEAGRRREASFERNSDDPELRELLECSTDEYVFCGIMDIHSCTESGRNLCRVDFKFLSNPKERLIKRYTGILILSATTNAVFCELTGNEQGEKTYLMLEKQDLGKEQSHVRCCMAMVLTYSSKVHCRRPCCERMVLSNSKIKEGEEEYEALKAYLRMNDSTIRITRWGYNELIKKIAKSPDPDMQKIIECFPDLESLNGNNVTIDECAFIPESIIYTLHSLSDAQKRKFEILLRNHSIAPWYSKTKATKADTLFKLLNTSHDRK